MNNKALIGFLLFIMFAGGAHADDPDGVMAAYAAEEALVKNCIRVARSNEEAIACVRITMLSCLARHSARSLVPSMATKGRCLSEEKQIWQGIYQKEVLDILRWAQSYDTDGIRFRARWGQAFQAVLDAEEVWKEYRSKQCNMENVHWGAGTIRGLTEPSCHIRMIAERIYLLRSQWDLYR